MTAPPTTNAVWSRRWHLWLTATAGTFALLETLALRTTGERATLTAHLRRTLGVSPYCPRRGAFGRALMLAVFGWCAVHLVFGRWPADGWLDSPASARGAAGQMQR